MTPQTLRRKIAKLPEAAPITEQFEREIVRRKSRAQKAWYSSQKEHWLGWLREYDGPGFYDRQTWEVTAETVYNRVVNSAMTLWLGEACGCPKAQVEAAAKAASKAGNTMQAQSAAIRRIISWPEIEKRL